MPHYGKQLKLLSYAPWADYYVDWRRLKKLIRQTVAKARAAAAASASSPPSSTSSTPSLTASQNREGYQILMNVASGDEAPSSSGPGTGATLAKANLWVVARGDIDAWLAEFEGERQRVEEFFSAELQLAEVKHDAAVGMSGSHGAVEPAVVKKTLFDAMVIAEELADFAKVNLVAFSKLAHKFCKHTRFPGEDALLRRVASSSFVNSLARVDVLGDAIKATYSKAFSPVEPQSPAGSAAKAPSRRFGRKRRAKLTLPQSDPVRELEQSVAAARAWKTNTILTQFDEYQKKAKIRSREKPGKSFVPAAIAAIVLFVLLFAPVLNEGDRPAQRCLGIMACATVLWVMEPWPLFVTSLLLPLLATLCGVVLDEDANPVDAVVAAKAIFLEMFPSNIALILAGFSIAQAFNKYGLDVKIAMLFLKAKFWNTPHRFLVAIELLTLFMSAFISNVAATVLLLTVAVPVIRGLPKRSVYSKTILLCIAVAGNVGGMTTQIASPQNAVIASLGEWSVDFVKFSLVSIPLTPVLLIAGHFIVYFLYRPDIAELPKLDGGPGPKSDIETAARLMGYSAPGQQSTVNVPWYQTLVAKQVFVALISVLSIGLWASSPWLLPFGRSIGVISLVPLVLFYGSRLLSKEDFEKMPWPLAILLSGGNVLGFIVNSSKLLELAAMLILHLPKNLWIISLFSGIVMMLAASFVSHTVAALVLLRLFARVGQALGHAKLLVMTSIMMDCGAMPLPISSFPNINTFSLENADGETYLKTIDFLKVGIPCTLLAFLGSNSITYFMSLIFKL